MPVHHYMLADMIAVSCALGLLGATGTLSGYAVGRLTNVLGFRSRSLAFRLAASVPLSVAILPILGYTIGRWFSLAAVWAVLGVLCGCAAGVAVHGVRKRRPWRVRRELLPFLALILVWLVIAFLSLADLQIEKRAYYSTIAFDHAIRTAVTASVATSGIPAQNPFYFPGQPAPLRYHYFWMIPCALVQWLGAPLVDARSAFIAGTMWCGVALICLIPLYLRLFSPQGAARLRRRSLAAICLLAVTGLDLLPALVMLWLHRKGLVFAVSPSVEWWNNQVDGWIYSLLWEAHYVCSLIACLVGFLVLWSLPPDAGRRSRQLAVLVAGVSWATAAGAGVYVALVFALFGALWISICLVRKWRREAGLLVAAGVVAAALVAPFFLGFPSYGSASGGSTIHLTLRSFYFGELVLSIFGIVHPAQLIVVDFLLLPLNYFLEFGYFFAVAWLVWRGYLARRQPPTRAGLASFTMLAASLLVGTFLRSTATHNNDIAWRGLLLAQFVLLLTAADLPPARGTVKLALAALLVLGAAGVVYDLAILRFYPVLSDAGVLPAIDWMSPDRKFGERTYANREAYEWLRAHTPARAVIQQNPRPVFQDTFYGMYGHRQTVAADPTCGAAFGGDPRGCAAILTVLAPLYSGGSRAFEDACARLHIDVFVARDSDPAWRDRESWIWTRRPVFTNPYVRLFACPATEGSAVH